MALEIEGYLSDHIYGNKSPNTNRGRFSGGISVYYKLDLKNRIKIVNKNPSGILWIKLDSDLFEFSENVYFCNVYNVPQTSTVINQDNFDFFEQLESDIEVYKPLGKIFISGDMNSRTSNLSDELDFDHYVDNDDSFMSDSVARPPRKNCDVKVDNNGRRLIDLCKATSLTIGNGRLHNDCNIGEFTFHSYNGSSTVDYLLLDKHDYKHVVHFNILQQNEFSDHSGINVCFKTKSQSHSSSESNVTGEKYIHWDETKIDEYLRLLSNDQATIDDLTTDVQNDNINIDNIISSFSNFMQDTAFSIFGKTRHKTNSGQTFTRKTAWFNADCYNARKEYTRARNKSLKSRNTEDRQSFINAKTFFNKVKRREKNKYKRKEKINLTDLARNKPKQFWKKVKNQYKNSKIMSENVHVNEFYDHFKKLYGSEPDATTEINENNENIDTVYNEYLDGDISYVEIKQAVFSQNNNKSSGLDNLTAEIFKYSFDKISKFLCLLFNRIYSEGEYPKAWGEGIITPVFKSRDTDNTQNYRGITLINVIAKIYSQVLLNRLTKWSTENEKIIHNQYGFQKNKSTTDCIFLLHAIISKTINSKDKLYCAFIDFEKCFDKIDRLYLWQKLLAQHVSSKMVRALQAMYRVVKSCVRYKSENSSFFTSNIGVKQGDPSSGLMFLFFINDILTNINSNIDGIFTLNEMKIFLLLFADDAVLFAQTPAALQSMLNDLEQYCNTWGLKINTNKTKVMIFERGRSTNHDFILCDKTLEIVQSFKYLGIHFFKNGSWYRTQKRLAQHSAFALHNLFIVFNQLEISNSDKSRLFDSLVGSVLNYNAAVWGNHESKDIELIHCKFLRKVLHVKKSTNLEGLYGELGRYPMKITR